MVCTKVAIVIALVAVFTISSNAVDIKDIYNGCFKDKGCFGEPTNCTLDSKKDCNIVVTYKKLDGDRIEFELQTTLTGNKRYVAVGLSEDDKMGKDSVVACVRRSTTTPLVVETSWNNAEGNTNKRDNPSKGWIKEAAGSDSSVKEFFRCTFIRDKESEHEEVKFDLTKEFSLLLASGELESNNNYKKHDKMRASPKKVKLAEKKDLDAYENGGGGAGSLQASAFAVVAAIAALVAFNSY